jgi:hypothetical protein
MSEGNKAVFWRPDPNWDRLHKQPSWGALLRELSIAQRVAVECKFSFTSRRYHCEFHRDEAGKKGYHRDFLSEGYGDHPLGAVRAALSRLREPIKPTIRSKLLEALFDYLRGEIEICRVQARG